MDKIVYTKKMSTLLFCCLFKKSQHVHVCGPQFNLPANLSVLSNHVILKVHFVHIGSCRNDAASCPVSFQEQTDRQTHLGGVGGAVIENYKGGISFAWDI